MTTPTHRRRVRLATTMSALALILALASTIDPLAWAILGGAFAFSAVVFATVAYVDLARRPLDDERDA